MMRVVLALGRRAAVVGVGVFALAGCRGGQADSAQAGDGGRYSVVCTTGMVADLARNIGRDRVRVIALMGEGVDPHLYVTTPGDVRKLMGADLILYSGLMLEGKMDIVFKKLAAKRHVVAVTERIHEDRLRVLEGTHGHSDPHVWFDVSLWMEAAGRARDALIEGDPEGRAVYSENAAAYLNELEELHEECKRRLATIPKELRMMVTAHDAFGYFGRAYDVEVRGLQGISTESEASLKDVNGLTDVIIARGIKAVFIESSVPPKNIEALVENCRARGHGLQLGGELFGDAMGAKGTPEGTYIGMVRHNVKTIVEALR